LSVTLTLAFFWPVLEGVNVTSIWHVPPGGSDDGQLLFSAKLFLFAPPRMIDLMVKVLVPLFFNVEAMLPLGMFTVWFPKLRLGGEKVTAG
jgi:hypothetical protein